MSLIMQTHAVGTASNRPSIGHAPSELNRSLSNTSPFQPLGSLKTEMSVINDSLLNFAGGIGMMKLASETGRLSPRRLDEVKISKFPHN